MYGMDQSSEWHHKDIYYHTMQVVDNAAKLSKKMKLRFAALVHDIAKPNTRRIDPKKGIRFTAMMLLASECLIRWQKE